MTLSARSNSDDFLWLVSSDFSLTLPELLARHRRQMVSLVVGKLALPHDEDDLQPLRPQRPERLAVRVSPGALLVIVRAGPFTRAQREERHVFDHVPQCLVTRVAELDDPLLLAASLRHRDGAGLRLQMAKRLPSTRRVPEASPERRRGNAVLTDREGSCPLRGRYVREKILDSPPVLCDRRHD